MTEAAVIEPFPGWEPVDEDDAAHTSGHCEHRFSCSYRMPGSCGDLINGYAASLLVILALQEPGLIAVHDIMESGSPLAPKNSE
jgi:hypothetical protein